MIKYTSIVLFIGLASLYTSVEAKLPIDANRAIEQVLIDHYGSDNQNGCLIYTYGKNNDSVDYCVKVKQAKLKEVNGQPQIYVLVSGDIIAENPGHAREGLGGLFVLEKNKGQWQLLASHPYILSGGWGISQLSGFELTKIGPAKYGWYGNYGYTSTGCTTSADYLFTNIGANIVPVFKNFDLDCSGNGDGWDSSESTVTILTNSPPINGYYPIFLKTVTYQYPDNHDVSQEKITRTGQRMAYSPKKQAYVKD